MSQTDEGSVRGGADGPGDSVCLAADSLPDTKPCPAAQAATAVSGPVQAVCCDLLRDDLCANIGAMIATLNAALATRDAANDAGLLYGLRCARAYWKQIAESARQLNEARQ